jgi:hypothetical protein
VIGKKKDGRIRSWEDEKYELSLLSFRLNTHCSALVACFLLFTLYASRLTAVWNLEH